MADTIARSYTILAPYKRRVPFPFGGTRNTIRLYTSYSHNLSLEYVKRPIMHDRHRFAYFLYMYSNTSSSQLFTAKLVKRRIVLIHCNNCNANRKWHGYTGTGFSRPQPSDEISNSAQNGINPFQRGFPLMTILLNIVLSTSEGLVSPVTVQISTPFSLRLICPHPFLLPPWLLHLVLPRGTTTSALSVVSPSSL